MNDERRRMTTAMLGWMGLPTGTVQVVVVVVVVAAAAAIIIINENARTK